MKTKDIHYFPSESKKGIWIIVGIWEYECTNILRVVKRCPSPKSIKKMLIKNLDDTYDIISVEQWEVE